MPILLIRKKKWMLLMQNLNFNLLQHKSVYSFLIPKDLSVSPAAKMQKRFEVMKKREEGMKLRRSERT